MFTTIDFELTLLRPMLGTNPINPKVLDKHIIDKARQLILKESKLDKTINKFADAASISLQREQDEVEKLLNRLEQRLGQPLSNEQLTAIAEGQLDIFKETLSELTEKGTTVFFWNKALDLPCIGDHMIPGFMKAAAEAIGRTMKTKGKGKVFESISYTQSLINQHISCDKNFITFDRDVEREASGDPAYLQRSLRAMTAQGPRISLTKSEVVPAGAKLSFNLQVMYGSALLDTIELKDDKGNVFKTAPAIEHIFDYGQLHGLGQWRNAGYGKFSYVSQALQSMGPKKKMVAPKAAATKKKLKKKAKA